MVVCMEAHEHYSVAEYRESGDRTYLESVELRVALEGHLRRHPLASARILVVEAHEKHGINGIYDGVPNASRFGQIRALAA